MQAPAPPASLSPQRALIFFNAFRGLMVLVTLLMALTGGRFGPALWGWAAGYGALIVVWSLLRRGVLAYTLQLTLGVATDIVMIVLLMQLNGGVTSGYGMLLLPFLAVAGLMSSGRFALLYGVLASATLLGAELADHLAHRDRMEALSQLLLLAFACFAACLVTWRLAKRGRASERLAAERAGEISQLNRLNTLVLQSLREAVVVLDERGAVRQCNQSAHRLLPTLVYGHRLLELMPLLEQWRAAAQRDKPWAIERRVRGNLLTGRAVPIVADDARMLVVFLRAADEIADEARREKLAALGRLTANLAHEIRNPLSAITHAADLLADDNHDDASCRLTRIMRDNSARLNRLVEDVLILNRRDRVKTEPLQLAGALGDFLEHFALARPDAADGVVLTDPISPQLTVQFDHTHLQQILWNLVNNAVRHGSGAAGAVKIAVIQDGQLAEIWVRDDGPGVSDSMQARLFEPFSTTESSGSGLGLFIARELAEANGGRLDYLPPGGCFRLTCVSTDA
jgi:two-component system sensor histidine kinase PilS (NtrC family)